MTVPKLPMERGLSPADDVALVACAKENDIDALGILYSRYVRPVFAFAVTQVGDRSDAEDVVQETFVALWESRHKIQLFTGSILPWLLATASYKCLNLRRSKARDSRAVAPLDDRVPSRMESPVERAEANLISAYIDGVVSSLEPTDRQLFEMCIVDKISYAKAAERLGLTHQTLRGKLARLRSRLRRELEPVKGEL